MRILKLEDKWEDALTTCDVTEELTKFQVFYTLGRRKVPSKTSETSKTPLGQLNVFYVFYVSEDV
jgi:hypothetical protein